MQLIDLTPVHASSALLWIRVFKCDERCVHIQGAPFPLIKDPVCREALGFIHWTYVCAGGEGTAICQGEEKKMLSFASEVC